MSLVSTPYRFVPLSRLVLLPDWADRVSHDHPFRDGVCGELRLQLHCHTPLCVGGKQQDSTETSAGKVSFYRTPDGQPAIPGSSLKGMLRNVLEIASFARFGKVQVQDQRLGVRDVTSSGNFYMSAINPNTTESGWLRFDHGQWTITPCSFSRIHQKDLIEHCNVPENRWISASSAKKRYEIIGLLPHIKFRTEPSKNKKRQAVADSAGPFTGCIVVTGQPGPAFNKVNRNGKSEGIKKYEFVFHDPAPGKEVPPALSVDEKVFNGFLHIHQDSAEWTFWRDHLSEGKLDQGIPVFFHRDGGKVSSLGLAFMYKLPYKHSLHEAIGHTHPVHLQAADQAPDLADLIFGHLGESGNSLRGRTGIGLATPLGQPSLQWQKPTVLSNPKPTFFPAYVRQDGKEHRQLMQRDCELSGWKRYPAKPVDILDPPEKSKPTVQVELEAVAAGTDFEFRIRVHNLRQVELGALLWALDFGDRPRCRHGLGTGKPYGLGQVSLSLTGWDLLANDPQLAAEGIDATWLDTCRAAYVRLMEDTLASAGSRWAESGPIKALLEFAEPHSHPQDLDYLRDPKKFLHLRTAKTLAEVQTTLHAHTGVVPHANFDTTQPRSGDIDFDRLREQQQREALKAQASDEDRFLIEIDELIQQHFSGQGTGSTLGKLSKKIRSAHSNLDVFSEGQIKRLLEMIGNCSAIENKDLQKACKKFSRGADA